MEKRNMIPDSTAKNARRKKNGSPALTEENALSETDPIPVATEEPKILETDLVPAPTEQQAVPEKEIGHVPLEEQGVEERKPTPVATKKKSRRKRKRVPAPAKVKAVGETDVVSLVTKEPNIVETDLVSTPIEERTLAEADVTPASAEEKTAAATDTMPASIEEHGMGEMGIVPARADEKVTDGTDSFPGPAEEQAAPEANMISAPTKEKAVGDRDVVPVPGGEKTAADTDFVPVSRGGAVAKRGDRSIGAILIDARRLKPEDAEQILRLQREQGLRFGEAATQLGLLTQADIEFALSRQFDYPYLLRGESKVSEELVAAYTPFSPQVEALRALRSQLMLRWFDSDTAHKALAVVSGARQEGRSFIAANLAVVFSQLGERTLLIDADMRNPCQHRLFALDNRAGLSAVLSGRGGPEAVQRIPSLRDLSVLPAGAQPPNPLELLARPLFPQLLQDLAKEFDVILLDSPASAEYADAQTLAIRAGAAVIVARKNVARIWQVRGVSDTVARASATVVGTVLNDF